jgi:hypothetical protein
MIQNHHSSLQTGNLADFKQLVSNATAKYAELKAQVARLTIYFIKERSDGQFFAKGSFLRFSFRREDSRAYRRKQGTCRYHM